MSNQAEFGLHVMCCLHVADADGSADAAHAVSNSSSSDYKSPSAAPTPRDQVLDASSTEGSVRRFTAARFNADLAHDVLMNVCVLSVPGQEAPATSQSKGDASSCGPAETPQHAAPSLPNAVPAGSSVEATKTTEGATDGQPSAEEVHVDLAVMGATEKAGTYVESFVYAVSFLCTLVARSNVMGLAVIFTV